MNNKMKVATGIMVAAMATLTVNLIGSKDVHANAGGGFDRGGDMFASGGMINVDVGFVEIGAIADFNQDGFDDWIAMYDGDNGNPYEFWVCLYEEGQYVKTWHISNIGHCWQALDVNGDGYPDVIEGCNGDGDEAQVYINQLGPGLACHTDLNDDGTVNITDLLVLIADWGDCL